MAETIYTGPAQAKKTLNMDEEKAHKVPLRAKTLLATDCCLRRRKRISFFRDVSWEPPSHASVDGSTSKYIQAALRWVRKTEYMLLVGKSRKGSRGRIGWEKMEERFDQNTLHSCMKILNNNLLGRLLFIMPCYIYYTFEFLKKISEGKLYT